MDFYIIDVEEIDVVCIGGFIFVDFDDDVFVFVDVGLLGGGGFFD